MSVNTVPRFVEQPQTKQGQVSAANTNRDGTGSLVSIWTGTTNGSKVDLIIIRATVTTTAGMVRLFLDDTSNVRLIKEIPVSAITPSATVEAFTAEYSPTKAIIIPSGWILKASTHNAEAINIFAIGGDY